MQVNYKQINKIYNDLPSMDSKLELEECDREDHDHCVVVNGKHMDVMGRID